MMMQRRKHSKITQRKEKEEKKRELRVISTKGGRVYGTFNQLEENENQNI